MNANFSKYFLYYPTTLLKGESVWWNLRDSRKFQYQNRSEIESYQLFHLQRIVRHAYCNAALYREIYDNANVRPQDIRSLDDLKNFPCVTKKNLVDRMDDMTAYRSKFLLSQKTTGGSTGQAVTLYKNAGALAKERAVTARSYEWAGVQIGDAQARFWGVPLTQMNRTKYKIVDFIANRKRFSAFAVTDELREQYFHDLVNFAPRYLYGYVSAILDFARFVRRRGYRMPASIVAVITTSEVLTDAIRAEIKDIFALPVFNEYGCGEVGSIAHECEAGSLHLMEDNLIVEIDSSSNADGTGEIIVTDLFNYATPLIRYRLGDFASIGETACSCGRTLKTLRNVHGRAYDVVVTEDGKQFHPEMVMYIFEQIKDQYNSIDQFQFVQKSVRDISIYIVRGKNYGAELEAVIRKALHDRLHPGLEITIDYVDTIAREKSGKLRVVKSLVEKP